MILKGLGDAILTGGSWVAGFDGQSYERDFLLEVAFVDGRDWSYAYTWVLDVFEGLRADCSWMFHFGRECRLRSVAWCRVTVEMCYCSGCSSGY